MPLIKSKSKSAFGKNVEKAIAYAVKREAQAKRKPKGKK